jgi:hypothetical protein
MSEFAMCLWALWPYPLSAPAFSIGNQLGRNEIDLVLCVFQAQLHAQLAELSSNLADTENLLRMTSVQAESMRGLGSWHGGLYVSRSTFLFEYCLLTTLSTYRFMAGSKVLGEQSVRDQTQDQRG